MQGLLPAQAYCRHRANAIQTFPSSECEARLGPSGLTLSPEREQGSGLGVPSCSCAKDVPACCGSLVQKLSRVNEIVA